MKIFIEQIKNKEKKQDGFVVLFTVLISVIVLVLATGIFNIALKETELTISAKESNLAFYAADAGSECALYYDLKQNAFNPVSPIVPECKDGTVADFDNISPTLFTFEFELSPRSCATVEVNKNFDIGGTSYTRIISQGYNIDCAQLDSFDTNRIVERLLEVKYPNPTAVVVGGGGDAGGEVPPPDGGAEGDDTGTGAL